MKTASLRRAVERLEAARDPDLGVYTLEQLVEASFGQALGKPAAVRRPGDSSTEELILAAGSAR